ncbi:DUF4326 domain-containing protein [Streptomyces albus]|uniref:DUF4326 domain-containing protein n=1 Tax=Streptomyces albus TaxID=1888 RepID=UPI0038795D27
MPNRIQRKRTKGWRAPEGAIYVGRGSRWGNPYRITRRGNHWHVCHDDGVNEPAFDSETGARTAALKAYRAYLLDDAELARAARRELAGRDLMCWCPLDRPCHAGVLLEIANGGEAA